MKTPSQRPKKGLIFIYLFRSAKLNTLRKLPSLSPSLVSLPPSDDPARHQGRIRSMPHVDGQFAAHVYVSLPLEPRSRMHTLVGDVLGYATETTPALHASPCFAVEEQKSILEGELHVSLSRPMYLRSHQREDLKRAIKAVARRCSP